MAVRTIYECDACGDIVNSLKDTEVCVRKNGETQTVGLCAACLERLEKARLQADLDFIKGTHIRPPRRMKKQVNHGFVLVGTCEQGGYRCPKCGYVNNAYADGYWCPCCGFGDKPGYEDDDE